MATNNVLPFEKRTITPPPADFDTRNSLETCQQMLTYMNDQPMSQLCHPCFVLFIINLNDLAGRANALKKRISFTDHLDPIDGINDVTDLISKVRNAVCHIRSPHNKFGEDTFKFTRILGYSPDAMETNAGVMGCDFPDDTAIYHGPYRFYQRRHGQRALDELAKIG